MYKAIPFNTDFDSQQVENMIDKWVQNYRPENVSAEILVKNLYAAMKHYRNKCVSQSDKLFFIKNDKICWIMFSEKSEGVIKKLYDGYLYYFECPVQDFLQMWEEYKNRADHAAIFMRMELDSCYEVAVNPMDNRYQEYLNLFLSGNHIAKNYTEETIERLLLHIKRTK